AWLRTSRAIWLARSSLYKVAPGIVLRANRGWINQRRRRMAGQGHDSSPWEAIAWDHVDAFYAPRLPPDL
ncbi:MAG: hypothetical protein PHP75_09340, partial [Methylacidiphilaceae bacterium]|nr:hypothetical protein [Candidatus Methylacidiphilaceae bacterium]